jgi:tRNA U34 5-carboxymethylaminomethyl modifying GTPase MnmE/TrmE
MSREQTDKIVEDLKKRLESGKEFLTASFGELLSTLIETLQLSRDKKFVFLLVGRTGVGKSSTVNTLMGKEVARVNPFEPSTMMVESYDSEINGIQFTVIDTPGLCDDLEEVGNDRQYLELIRSRASQLDVMWFVSPLNDTRVRVDEKRGIKLISEAFSSEVWERAVIVFTFADKVDASDYPLALQKRTELIRKEIAKYTGDQVANNIPSVAVANKNETTPDGRKWLGELYTKVFVRMSEKGTIPFLLATAARINLAPLSTSIPNNAAAGVPNWTFYDQASTNESVASNAESSSAQDDSTGQRFEFNEKQKEEVKKKLFDVIPVLEAIGEAIGSTVGAVGGKITAEVGGAVGKKIGGAVGHAVEFIGSLFGWF